MSDVEKRTSALVVCFLNNSYGFFTSLQAFLNLSVMQKQQKRNKIIHKIILSPISKSSKKKKGKQNSSRFFIRLGQNSSQQDNFCACHKVSEEWKEYFHMPQESFEKLCTMLRPYIQKKNDSEIQFQWKNKWPQHYFTWQMKERCEVANSFGMGTSTISKVLTRVSFYFRKFFHCIYLTKEHNYFANRKSYRTTLFT